MIEMTDLGDWEWPVYCLPGWDLPGKLARKGKKRIAVRRRRR